MKNDPEVLIDMLNVYDQVKISTRPGSQEMMCALARIRATIKALKDRMTNDEIDQVLK